MKINQLSKRVIYGYFFMGVLLIFCYFVWGLPASVGFLWYVIFYFFIFYFFYWFIQKLRGKEIKKMSKAFERYIYKLSIFLTVLCVSIWWFVFYQNHINPATMPLYTISNGDSVVKFQTMSHIASQEFYDTVISEISDAKNNGYVLFYEWVTPWTEDNQEILDDVMWVEITPELYETFSIAYGVTHQNNEDFLGIVNDLDFNVDMDIDTIVDLYLEKIPPDQAQQYLSQESKETPTEPSVNQELLNTIAWLSDRQLLLMQNMNKSFLNFFIKHGWLREYIISQMNVQDLFYVILDERNEYLVEEIRNSEYKKIFVTYGLMHFDWVLELLQASDPNWKILETTSVYPISSPGISWSW